MQEDHIDREMGEVRNKYWEEEGILYTSYRGNLVFEDVADNFRHRQKWNNTNQIKGIIADFRNCVFFMSASEGEFIGDLIKDFGNIRHAFLVDSSAETALLMLLMKNKMGDFHGHRVFSSLERAIQHLGVKDSIEKIIIKEINRITDV